MENCNRTKGQETQRISRTQQHLGQTVKNIRNFNNNT